MQAKLIEHKNLISERELTTVQHLLVILPEQSSGNIPFADVLMAKQKRRHAEYKDLLKSPIAADLPNGGMVVWSALKTNASAFDIHTSLRKAIVMLLEEKPETLTIVVLAKEADRRLLAEAAAYVTWVNSAELPSRKMKSKKHPLKTISIFGVKSADAYAQMRALAAGNTLARSLTLLPPNDLTPAIYRDKLEKLAAEEGWRHESIDMKALSKMGAGAFVAVGQGSEPQDAAIVHLTYNPKKAVKTIALVGKGICFDTGGHNLKPARYMHGMHADMAGSAVAVGILLAASRAKLPIQIECWLAIAQNHIGPKAYKQNDVVTALNGTTIEIVHTDAEGRMVLADTLTLASRQKPAVLIDFATLTGSMVTALGDRYSGIIGNCPEMLCQAVGVGAAVGERVNAFPFDEDYEEDLESKIADIKQCTLEGEADHILAARFLYQFVDHRDDIAWLHVDLSSYHRKGGLGAVDSDVNGFGVGFGLGMLELYAKGEQ